jgi:hypothetical protein
MRWNNRAKTERPEYPKMVAITAQGQEALDLLSTLAADDPQAEIVNGGSRGLFLKVHNEAAENAARRVTEARNFPLAPTQSRWTPTPVAAEKESEVE